MIVVIERRKYRLTGGQQRFGFDSIQIAGTDSNLSERICCASGQKIEFVTHF
jgi:hypothetical protein